jgi:hypothetical protein
LKSRHTFRTTVQTHEKAIFHNISSDSSVWTTSDVQNPTHRAKTQQKNWEKMRTRLSETFNYNSKQLVMLFGTLERNVYKEHLQNICFFTYLTATSWWNLKSSLPVKASHKIDVESDAPVSSFVVSSKEEKKKKTCLFKTTKEITHSLQRANSQLLYAHHTFQHAVERNKC